MQPKHQCLKSRIAAGEVNATEVLLVKKIIDEQREEVFAADSPVPTPTFSKEKAITSFGNCGRKLLIHLNQARNPEFVSNSRSYLTTFSCFSASPTLLFTV
jgi:hypothetical protein